MAAPVVQWHLVDGWRFLTLFGMTQSCLPSDGPQVRRLIGADACAGTGRRPSAFPLTPAFSRRERESRGTGVFVDCPGVALLVGGDVAGGDEGGHHRVVHVVVSVLAVAPDALEPLYRLQIVPDGLDPVGVAPVVYGIGLAHSNDAAF